MNAMTHPAKLIDWTALIRMLPRGYPAKIAARVGRDRTWVYGIMNRGTEPAYSDGVIVLEYWQEVVGPDVLIPVKKITAQITLGELAEAVLVTL